ncbi:MAG: peptide-N-glycosidase F-related protein [Myxococcota bacterium]
MMCRSSLWCALLLPFAACDGEETKASPSEPTYCELLDLSEVDFDPTAPAEMHRHEPAGDFTVPLVDGTTWTLSEQWTGCDVYLFIPHWIAVSSLNEDTYWTTGVEELIARSPTNAHYFFVVAGRDSDAADALAPEMQDRIDETLATLDEDLADLWGERLHVVAGPSDSLDGLVESMFDADISYFGWGIDREQKIRSLGYFPDVDAFDTALNAAGEWPWEQQLYSAAAEVEYFNFEAARQAALDAVDATIVEVFDGSVVEQLTDGTVALPDAATMASFDTLEIDVRMECPDKDGPEISNCGPWDYLAHMYLYDEATEEYLEMARFITTYHRESRWVVDASHALAWLQDGGTRSFRYTWAPEWNTQPTGVTVRFRLYNQDKGVAPREIIPLFTGGSFNREYNNERPPVEVEIPADAQKVEIVSIITGHGGETQNCAEFCPHSHHFTVGAETYETIFDEPGDNRGCAKTVSTGTVPNQAGTWWFGRGGWCPGREVDPFVADVTDQITPGQTATIAYEAKYNGGDLIDNAGNIRLNSWLVVHR